MSPNLESLYAQLSLGDRKDEQIPYALQNTQISRSKGNFCLMGKVLAKKQINMDVLYSTMKKARHPSGHFSFKTVSVNSVVFRFSEMNERNRILENGPWSFDRQLIMLQEFDGDVPLKQALFTHYPLWVQIHDLPLNLMNASVAQLIGNKMGGFIALDADADGLAWGRFMRIRINLDISFPLMRVVKLSCQGVSHTGIVRYERLPNFCFYCGKIGHVDKDCADRLSLPIAD